MAIYKGSDCYIRIVGLRDKAADSGAGEYITSGTVTAQLKDPDGTEIGNGTNIGSAITMSYLAAWGGVTEHTWYGVIEEDVDIDLGQMVDVVVTATASTDRVRVFKRRERVMLG